MSITDLTATELRTALHSGAVSAVEVMTDYRARIDRLNPRLNAMVSLLPADMGLRLAADADAKLAKGTAGPLCGFPLAVKDLADLQGFKTTMGSPLFGAQPALRDALMVARLRAADGCFIGKTNVPEFGFGSHTFNPVFGTTLNPHNTALTAGGSSGGAASALAAHLLVVADGSDFGGSLRNPASFCGVVGLRPSVGRVASESYFGWMARIGVQGPMARNVRDTALMLSVQAGFNKADPLSFPSDTAFDSELAQDFSRARIAWTENFDSYPVEPEVAQICTAAATRIAEIGCHVEAAHPEVAGAMDVFQHQRAAAVRGTAQYLEASVPNWRDQVKDTAAWNLDKGLDLSFEEYHASERARTRITQGFSKFFDGYDFLILPTVQVLPFAAETPWVNEINGIRMPTYLDWMSSCCIISITDLPALSIPVGYSSAGLPVGLQIVGPPKADLAVLQFGYAVEQLLGLTKKPPPALNPSGLDKEGRAL